MNEIYLIGLGNPGKKYSNSRHNIGFLILENFSRKHNSSFLLKDKLRSSFSEFKINDSTYRLFLIRSKIRYGRMIIFYNKKNQFLLKISVFQCPLRKFLFMGPLHS